MLEDGGPWGVNLVSRMFAASGWKEFELTDRSTAGTTEWPFNYPHDICGWSPFKQQYERMSL